MASLFDKPLGVGQSDSYTFSFPLAWLDGATITSVSLTVPSGGAGVSGEAITGRTVGALFTGVTTGRHIVHCAITLSDGRTDCTSGVLTVADC